jgi:hypothetical protein
LTQWKFGDTYTSSNGAVANSKINGVDFMLQENWDPVLNACSLTGTNKIVDQGQESGWDKFVNFWRNLLGMN